MEINSSNKKMSSTKRNKRRKIRCIQDFDSLNRSSLSLGVNQNANAMSEQNVKTKKQQNFDFLPKVEISSDVSKKNSPKLMNNCDEKKCSVSKMKVIETPANVLKIHNMNTNAQILNGGITSIISPLDEDIEFKPRQKNKKCPVGSSSVTLPPELMEDVAVGETVHLQNSVSLINKNTGTVENVNDNSQNVLEKVYCDRKMLRDPHKINDSRKSKQLSIVSNSMKVIMENITPDTSGNNQGIFNVTYPIEEEFMSDASLLALSTLEAEFERNNSSCEIPEIIKNLNEFGQSKNEPVDQRLSKDNTNLPSTYSTNRQNGESIIDLITPSPNKQSYTDKSTSTPTPTKLSPSPLENKKYQHLIQESGKRISLNRSATFTKEISDEKNLTQYPEKENSILNTTRASIRKRWKKTSRASLLDNSGVIHLISAHPTDDSVIYKDTVTKIFPLNENIQQKTNCVKMLSSKPFLASTPLVVTNQKQNKLLQMLSHKKKSNEKSIKKTKMPNFAQIHQKAYEKMENIKEMSERKATRAQALLSGLKPAVGLGQSSSKSRKELTYSPICKKLYTPSYPIKHQTQSQLEPANKVSKLFQKKVEKFKLKSGIPVPNHVKVASENVMIPKRLSKEKTAIPKPAFQTKQVPLKKLPSQQENLKAFANKKRFVTETVENRRQAVQKVRTNRRFELLMQMRRK